MMFLYIVQIQTVSFHLGLKIILSSPKSTGLSFSQVKVPFCRYTHLPPKKIIDYIISHFISQCAFIFHIGSSMSLRLELCADTWGQDFSVAALGVAAPSETERHVFSHTSPFYGWKLIYWSTPLGFTQTPLASNASNGRTCWISRPCPVACNAWCRPWRFCPWQKRTHWGWFGLPNICA